MCGDVQAITLVLVVIALDDLTLIATGPQGLLLVVIHSMHLR